MLEEKPQSIGQKLWKGLVGLFLGILVVMLIITLLPAGDMDDSLINQITGKVSTSAGTVGDRSIPMDYFNSARKDCYFRYKESAPNLASNESMISNCAFQTLRSIFVGKDLADAFGYRVSELAIRRELSRQARQYHSEASAQAGFDPEDLRSVEEIFGNLLRSEPIQFRIEMATAMSMFDGFLLSDIKKSSNQVSMENEARATKIAIRLLPFKSSQLNEMVEKTLEVTNSEIQAEYEKETKAGTTPKGEDGKPLSLEDRKSILSSKIRFEKRNKAVEEKRSELRKKRQDGAGLDELSELVSNKPISFKGLSIEDLNSINHSGDTYRLSQVQDFLKDMSELGFGTGKIGGPYQDGDKNFFIEFTSFELPKSDLESGTKEMDSRSFLAGLFMEMSQSMGKERSLTRNLKIAGE